MAEHEREGRREGDSERSTAYAAWAGIILTVLGMGASGIMAYQSLTLRVDDLSKWRDQHDAAQTEKEKASAQARTDLALHFKDIDDSVKVILQFQSDTKAWQAQVSTQLAELQQRKTPR